MKIKKTLSPESVVAVIDSREQLPLKLDPLTSRFGTLATGDYSVVGMEHLIAIERKSLQDLIGCVGRDRERFEKEIQRLLAYPCRALVVEATWEQIETHDYRGEVHPNAVMGSLMGWITRGIPVIMIGTHERAAKWVSRMLYLNTKRRYEEILPLLLGNEQAVDLSTNTL